MEDQNNRKRWIDGIATLSTLILSVGLVLWKNGGINSHGIADALMFAVFLVFFAWLLLPRRSKDAHHEHPGQFIAFRLGKALNGIFRPFKSRL